MTKRRITRHAPDWCMPRFGAGMAVGRTNLVRAPFLGTHGAPLLVNLLPQLVNLRWTTPF